MPYNKFRDESESIERNFRAVRQFVTLSHTLRSHPPSRVHTFTTALHSMATTKTTSSTHKENASSPTIRIPARSGKKPKKEKGPPKNAKWSSVDDSTLIMVLKTQQGLGNQADNNWKKLVWAAAVKELAGSERLSGGAPKKEKSCSDRWNTVRLPLRLGVLNPH